MSSDEMNTMPPRVFNSFEELAQVYAPELPTESEPSIYYHPDIPEKKLQKAIKSYASGLNPDQALVMWDSTVFGSGKKGFIITEKVFYYSEVMDKPWVVPYLDIQSISVKEDEDNIPWLNLQLPDRLISTNDGIDMKLYELSDFLNAAKNFHSKA